jgi:hypothetical protein
MSERGPDQIDLTEPLPEPGIDREIDLKSLAYFAIGLIGLTGIALLLMWLLVGVFRSAAERADPLPSPLEEANQPRVPPAPRLQERPEAELLTFRLQEQDVLTSYGWVSESAGVARIPIERAIEILAERGLPATPAAPAPAPPAAEEREQR